MSDAKHVAAGKNENDGTARAWRDLSPRARHWLESAEGADTDDLAAALFGLAERLRDIIWNAEADDDAVFEASLVLWTLGQAVSTEGVTDMRLVVKRRRQGGRPRLSWSEQARYRRAAVDANSAMRQGMTRPEAIAAAVAEIQEKAAASGHTVEGQFSPDGVSRELKKLRSNAAVTRKNFKG